MAKNTSGAFWYEVYPLYDFVPIAEKLKLENAREKR
jgi:hypothetical protein